MWSFLPGFFQLAKCVQSLSVLEHVSVLHSFLRLNNVPLSGVCCVCSLGSKVAAGEDPVLPVTGTNCVVDRFSMPVAHLDALCGGT